MKKYHQYFGKRLSVSVDRCRVIVNITNNKKRDPSGRFEFVVTEGPRKGERVWLHDKEVHSYTPVTTGRW
jgi:hypothetical protein